MFCGNCGKEIKDGVAFCPCCGAKITAGSRKQAGGEERQMQESDTLAGREMRIKTRAPEKREKCSRKKIWLPILLVLCVVAGYLGYQKIVERTITSEIENKLALVKNGVDTETAEQLLNYVVPQLVDNEMVSSLILENVTGEDVMDIYYAMVRYMGYEVVDVKMVELGHYQAFVRIDNLNNGLVAARAFELFTERYNTGFLGKIAQGLEDWNSDKSKLVAEMMVQAADDYYSAGDGSYWISKEYVIDIVKSEGEWVPTTDYEALISGCLGLG